MSGQAESAVRTGNIAVLRNALLNCRTRFKSLAMTNPEWRQCAEEHVREIDIALSAPARNCDLADCATPPSALAAIKAATGLGETFTLRAGVQWLLASAGKGGTDEK